MRQLSLLFLIGILCHCSFAQKSFKYPQAPKDSAVDIYFDTKIEDPYQWMENPEDPRLALWLESQEKLKRKIDKEYTFFAELRNRLSAMYSGVRSEELYTYVDDENKVKSKYEFDYMFKKTTRFPNLLYRLRDQGNFKMLIDTKKFEKAGDGNFYITDYFVNEEEDLVAVKGGYNGSDWKELFFFNLQNGEQLPHSLKYLRSGSKVIWDGKGVFYECYEAPEDGRELLDKAVGKSLKFHSVGTPQKDDSIVISQNELNDDDFSVSYLKDKLFLYHGFQYNNKTYKAISMSEKSVDSFSLKRLMVYPNDSDIDVSVKLVFGDSIYMETNWQAPNGRVLMLDVNKPNQPIEVIPEYDVALIEVDQLGKDKIACVYRNDGGNLAFIFDLKGTLLKRIDFPQGKKVHNLRERDEQAEFAEFSVSSFYHPPLPYQLSLKNLTFKPSVAVSVPFDPKSLETRYVKYKSKDGTEIPMYITCLKKTKLNGKNPTLIYGYGGYGYTVEPSYDQMKALWVLQGGILAIPSVRGGGAEGSDWGMAGRRRNKQNSIDDFIGAAEYLISENYTTADQIGASGKSHGALLVTAAAMQRPELFNVVVAEAGPYDMLRFENYTVGGTVTNHLEFGTTKNNIDFENLKSYSPLHNLPSNTSFPNMLLITGDSDDRVPPFHSFKYIASLQEKGNSDSMYSLYVVPGSGHGGALSSEAYFDKVLFEYAFMYKRLF